MRNGSIIIAEKLKLYDERNLHKCEVHLNLWKNALRQKFHLEVEYLLDIGIKIFDYKNTIDSLVLFFPFDLQKDDVSDLGNTLSNTKSLVNTIFNESMIYTAGEGNQGSLCKYESKVKDQEEQKRRSFILYTLAPSNYAVSKKDGLYGAFLTIQLSGADLSDSDKNGNLYIRFRITIKDASAQSYLKRDENLANDVLQAAFSKTELYDIRINDRRETDDKVLEEIETTMHNTLMPINKAHFFFVTNVVDQVLNGTSERMDTRMLEMDKWSTYVPYNDEHPRIAYHWKKVAEKGKAFENFEIFFRNTCDNRNYRKILLYLFVAFWIGAVGSLISSISADTDKLPWIGYILVVLMTFAIICYYFNRKL